MGIVIYLNQEVPACIDNPSPTVNPVLNYSQNTVEEVNTQLNNVSISEPSVVIVETKGQSMLPEIKPDQRCSCIRSEYYSVGDIVVFFRNFGSGYEGVMHKIAYINTTSEEIITKGINNNFTDSLIHQNNILCKIPTLKRWELIGL